MAARPQLSTHTLPAVAVLRGWVCVAVPVVQPRQRAEGKATAAWGDEHGVSVDDDDFPEPSKSRAWYLIRACAPRSAGPTCDM